MVFFIAFATIGATSRTTMRRYVGRPLCGLAIGRFARFDATRADDGKIYDPKNGKTYSAAMTLDGAELRLRGYVGIKLFGRTEIWRRYSGTTHRCDDGGS